MPSDAELTQSMAQWKGKRGDKQVCWSTYWKRLWYLYIYAPVIECFTYDDLVFIIIEIFQSSNISSTFNYRIKNKKKLFV